jgi:MFS family permease
VRLPPRLDVLHERDFRLFFCGNVVSLTGDAMLPVALSFAVLERYDRAGPLGIVLTAHSVPLVVLLLFGGVVADRLPRRTVLMASDGASCVVQAAAAVLIATGHWQLWQLAALEAVRGGAHAFAGPTYSGLLREIAPQDRLQEANALRNLGWSVASVVGPAVAGLFVVAGGAALALGANAASFGVSVVTLAAIRPHVAVARERSTMLADLREGWDEFRSRTWLWVIVAQFGIMHLLTLPAVYVLGALVSKNDYGGPKPWALALTASGIGSVLGGVTALHLNVRRPLLVATFGTIGYGLFAMTLAVRAPLPLVALAAASSGLGFAVFGTLWETTLQRLVPPERLSRVSAYDWFGSVALLPLGYALIGPMTGAFGVTTMLWVAVAALFVPTFVVLCVPAVTSLTAWDEP